MCKVNVTVDLNYIRNLEEENVRLKAEFERVSKNLNDEIDKAQNKFYYTEKELKLAKLFLSAMITENRLQLEHELNIGYNRNPIMTTEIIPRALDLTFENDGFGRIKITRGSFLQHNMYNVD